MTFTFTAVVKATAAKFNSRPALGTRSAHFAYGCTQNILIVNNR
jgi:hypothetical protein